VITPKKPVFGGYMGTGVVRPEMKLKAGKLYQYIVQTPASRALSLLYNRLPTYSYND
jgi:hypothetical protein